jgi:Aromatic-ring-opening dioxygenase LigAB, LigA subunit
MSNSLNNFLVDLACDPARMDAFLADPSRVVNESSLSADERAAVLTRDADRIREALHITPWQAAMPQGVTAKRPPAKGKPKPPPGKPGKKK